MTKTNQNAVDLHAHDDDHIRNVKSVRDVKNIKNVRNVKNVKYVKHIKYVRNVITYRINNYKRSSNSKSFR